MARRIPTLDYLRGIAASIVMVGHYYGWLISSPSPLTLHKLVTFSVSIFYILSGITLYHVYSRNFEFNFEHIRAFAVKRMFRILPLLWIATFATIYLESVSIHWDVLAWNLSGFFGLSSKKAGIARLAWSIGNEMVFYLVFPIFLICALKRPKLFLIAALSTLIPAVYYTFIKMQGATIESKNFKYYIYPLNHLFLFVGGIAIAHFAKNTKIPNPFYFILLLVALFVTYPLASRMEMFSSIHRFNLAGICALICVVLINAEFSAGQLIGKVLEKLGEISYSVYLLHPICFLVVSRNFNLDGVTTFALCVCATLLISYLVYQLIEKPLTAYARRLVKAPGNAMVPR